MSNYDLEEELNRIKLEFDQKFGGTGMSFDELPDDLESMLNQPQYTVPSKNTPVYSQPVQHSRPQQQSRPTQPLQSPKVVDTEIPDYDDYETIEPRNFTLNQKAMVASYLDEEEELETEFDDALPPLEDMLLLIKNPEIHKAYNYTLPKRQIVQPQYQQPQYQPQQQQHQSQGGGIPPLDQPAWNVRDCESVVQHLKSLLMSVLQDALTVKKMDLANSANASKTENILKKSGNQLKEKKRLLFWCRTSIPKILTILRSNWTSFGFRKS